MANEQVEIEFPEQLQQMQLMQQNPQMMQDPKAQQQMQQVMLQIESRKAKLIAEMMEEFMIEEKKIISQFDNDPIARLRSRELDLKAMEDHRKGQESQDRLNLDRMKAMMNQSTQQEKIEQNEELAELRAETSLEKQEMANQARKELARMKPRGN